MHAIPGGPRFLVAVALVAVAPVTVALVTVALVAVAGRVGATGAVTRLRP
ncbi:hypothetical protein ACLGIH_05910 [Streptomyces sp. HMX87]